MEGDEFRLIVGEMGFQVSVVDDFGEVRADRVEKQQLSFDILKDDVLVHLGGIFMALEEVFFLQAGKIVEGVLEDISESHVFEGLVGLEDAVIDFGGEASVNPSEVFIVGVSSHVLEVVNGPLDPGFKVGKSENTAVGSVVNEVGVIEGVTSIGEGDSGSVGTVLVDTVVEGQEVSFLLGHFFSVDGDITVAEEASGPVLGVFPDGGVVV